MDKKINYIKSFRLLSIVLECLWILLVIIFFTLFYFNGKDNIEGNAMALLPYMLTFCILASLNIVALVYAFEISLTEYRLGDNRLGVYAGGLYHHLYINDQIVDTVKSVNFFKEITLNGKLNDNEVEANISSFTHVTLKIDGKGIPPIGHNRYEDK